MYIKVPSEQPGDVPNKGPTNDVLLLLLQQLEFDESPGSLMALGLLLMFNLISSLVIASFGWIWLQRVLKGVNTVAETVSKIRVNVRQDSGAGGCWC